jgi:hypothetical protein
MAREPLRKEAVRTFRCLDEDGFRFTGKMEYVGQDAGEEEGYSQGIRWEQGRSLANCPHDTFHRIELVEE